MADFSYTSIAGQIHLVPIKEIKIIYNGDTYTIGQIEAESSYNITPITATNDLGQVITLYYQIEATIYITYNDYDVAKSNAYGNNVIKLLEGAKNADNPQIEIVLGNTEINYTTNYSLHLDRQGVTTSINFEIESVELRNRIKINIIGYAPFITDPGLGGGKIFF